MPNYLGLEKEGLIRSINDALELLETHSIGPECQKHIDKLRTVDAATGQSPLGAIAAATDDVALAKAVGSSGAPWLFKRTAEVLYFHGDNNTAGKGRDILTQLHKWDALGGARTLELGLVDQEAEKWLKRRLIRRAVLKVFGKTYKEPAEAKSPFQYYGAVIDDLSSGKINWTDSSVKKIREKVDEALEPFRATGDVRMVGIGIIMDFNSASEEAMRKAPLGVMFEATKRAAQAVADALPDYKTIDGSGGIIVPQTRTNPPKSGPKP